MRQSQRYVREPVNWTQLQPNWESSSSSMECQIERSVYQRTERRNASETLLPDRPISPQLNQVAEAGLKALEAPASRGAWSNSGRRSGSHGWRRNRAGRSDLHRAGECAVSCSRRQWRRLPQRDRARHRTRLVMAARERHLSEVYRQRCGLVCLIRR